MKKEMPQNVRMFNNPYRNHWKFYNPVKGHTGLDFRYNVGDVLLSPITGTVVKLATQHQMGKVVYVRHTATGDIYVFAHNSKFLVKKGQKVKLGDPLTKTGNTGTATTAPHVHFEIITKYPINKEDRVMTRRLWNFRGYNTNPLKRLKWLYAKYNLNLKTGKPKFIKPLITKIKNKINKDTLHKPNTYQEMVHNIDDMLASDKYSNKQKEILLKAKKQLTPTSEYTIEPVLPKSIQHQNNCTFFSVCNALKVLKIADLDPDQLYVDLQKDKYPEQEKPSTTKGFSYKEVLDFLVKQEVIKGYRKTDFEDDEQHLQTLIYNDTPVMVLLSFTAHAVCLYGYDCKGYKAYDSLQKNSDGKRTYKFSEIKHYGYLIKE